MNGRGTGAAPYSNTALGATAVLVKTGKCSLSFYHLFNSGSAEAYVQFFNAAAAADVTVGTTVPTFTLGIPAESVSGAGAGACLSLDRPINFTLGMVIASTTTPTGSSAATTVVTLGIGD